MDFHLSFIKSFYVVVTYLDDYLLLFIYLIIVSCITSMI